MCIFQAGSSMRPPTLGPIGAPPQSQSMFGAPYGQPMAQQPMMGQAFMAPGQQSEFREPVSHQQALPTPIGPPSSGGMRQPQQSQSGVQIFFSPNFVHCLAFLCRC